MGHDETEPSLIQLMLDQCKEHGFSPFHVKQSSIGYIYNRYVLGDSPTSSFQSQSITINHRVRIWAAIKRETLLLLSEDVATPQEVDAIFKDVLKTPKGPCEQMDVVGLDIVLDIEKHYADSRTGLPKEPRDYLQKMIHNGQLGVKSGRGFYEYTADSRIACPRS
jgi:hypothetical protein